MEEWKILDDSVNFLSLEIGLIAFCSPQSYTLNLSYTLKHVMFCCLGFFEHPDVTAL